MKNFAAAQHANILQCEKLFCNAVFDRGAKVPHDSGAIVRTPSGTFLSQTGHKTSPTVTKDC
jgi:hypothetical protein